MTTVAETFYDLMRGDWAEKMCALLMALCAALVIGLVAWAVFTAADSWYLPDESGTAKIVGRTHHPMWIQTIVHNTGKTTWTQVIVHPESWSIRLQLGNESDSVSVSRIIYDAAIEGEPVPVRFRHGRFSGGLYIVHASFK